MDRESRKNGHFLTCLKLSVLFLTIILVSVATSYLMIKEFVHDIPEENIKINNDHRIKETETDIRMIAQSPVSLKQTQDRPDSDIEGQALLVLDSAGLPDRLAWRSLENFTYIGPGITRVKVTKGSDSQDGLQVTRSSLYQLNVQVTFRIPNTKPYDTKEVYITAVKITADHRQMVAKSSMLIPRKEIHIGRQINTLIKLSAMDTVYVTVSDSDLVYNSVLDNFFSLTRH